MRLIAQRSKASIAEAGDDISGRIFLRCGKGQHGRDSEVHLALTFDAERTFRQGHAPDRRAENPQRIQCRINSIRNPLR